MNTETNPSGIAANVQQDVSDAAVPELGTDFERHANAPSIAHHTLVIPVNLGGEEPASDNQQLIPRVTNGHVYLTDTQTAGLEGGHLTATSASNEFLRVSSRDNVAQAAVNTPISKLIPPGVSHDNSVNMLFPADPFDGPLFGFSYFARALHMREMNRGRIAQAIKRYAVDAQAQRQVMSYLARMPALLEAACDPMNKVSVNQQDMRYTVNFNSTTDPTKFIEVRGFAAASVFMPILPFLGGVSMILNVNDGYILSVSRMTLTVLPEWREETNGESTKADVKTAEAGDSPAPVQQHKQAQKQPKHQHQQPERKGPKDQLRKEPQAKNTPHPQGKHKPHGKSQKGNQSNRPVDDGSNTSDAFMRRMKNGSKEGGQSRKGEKPATPVAAEAPVAQSAQPAVAEPQFVLPAAEQTPSPTGYQYDGLNASDLVYAPVVPVDKSQ